MAKPGPKLTLSVSRDIPFNKLVLSQSNVRRIKAGVSIEELAEDIARRTLLQSLTVRPIIDETGAETGIFEIPAGGRRYRALELLVKQKRLARTAPVPCVIRIDGTPEEDSLAENVQRAPLHPLDQFRAFLTLREKGRSEEEIAAAFFISVSVVRQRLRLAALSPALLDVYAEDGMTLEQLMAFTINPDHARQEQVWEAVQRSFSKEPYQIRRLLTEGAVRASDKRAQFVGFEAYEAAGGIVLRDLFQSDDGGWLQDPALLDRVATEKLEREADAVRAEGWKWVEVAPDFPYGHTYGLRRLIGQQRSLTEEEASACDALRTEYDRLEPAHADAEGIPEEADQRLAAIETALAAFDDRPMAYEPAEIARAGAFVSIDGAGGLRVERGFVRREDEPPAVSSGEPEPDSTGASKIEPAASATDPAITSDPAPEPEDDEGVRPLPDRLLTELTAHRTVALRDALGSDPDAAFLAALHVLCLKLFYRYGLDSCLEIEPKSAMFGSQAPGLADTVSAQAIDARHAAWSAQLPKDSSALWDGLVAFDHDSRRALFAHCVSLTVNAVHESWNRRPKALAHADRLAETVGLDMAAVGWRPTVDTYFGRVTKGRILAAVREAKGRGAADRIAHLKKPEMASAAEALLVGTRWVPEPLRAPGHDVVVSAEVEADSGEAQSAATGGEPAMDRSGAEEEDSEASAGIAAE
ncbi:DNA-binding protein [Rhodoplanes elegans]|uniref:DNA-binding protein n=1 Tax=Rhodoplanes elegans TaxID=29408 RepID=A0A327KLL9_9BRAD|nr:ParB/RepB/Spo0J family partition protein [Rhodoplanes elegans]MBK5957047.1 DNA-binding protein [Rhodoplanes elegans]RAI39151.1 DNA-binding protein [Rhodoplanes elegans]